MNLKGQESQNAIVYGVIISDDKPPKPIADVQILVNGVFTGVLSNKSGWFEIEIPANTQVQLIFTYVGIHSKLNIEPLEKGKKKKVEIILPAKVLDGVDIKESKRPSGNIIKLNPKIATQIPGVGSGVESIVKTLPGVASGNELSSQYNVRGGSYDENLVYVNDFEVFRPQLVRTGQQEGLSFINPFMVNNISFSAGGFESKYGDKMSSVLDVEYRTPGKFEATGEISFMGAELNMGGISKNKRFSYIAGLRYLANNYILNSLDVKGQYNPRFLDFQSLLVYNLNRNWRLEWLSNISQNKYQLIPVSQTTSFGTIQTALKLFVVMAGNEVMEYNSAMSGLSLVFEPSKELTLKFMTSGVSSIESEKYDIFGAYELNLVENNMGSDDFGNVIATLGNGYFINHARNQLYYQILSFDHKGVYKPIRKNIEVRWGLGYRKDIIEDAFKEWHYSDSSEYNINPNHLSFDSIFVSDYINSKITITNARIQGFGQLTWTINPENAQQITFGVRSHYSSINNQNVISPRLQYSIEPNRRFNRTVTNDSLMKRDYVLRAATGYYYQPPFYREMRDFDGRINTSLKAQRSIHFITGADYYFKMWKRPFKLFTEVYYKDLDYLVPFVVDNMRIRYYADNTSHGYATGIDTRINGQFIPGLESWFTFSFLKTSEQIRYIEDGVEKETPFLRRPTDRRVSASLFFQDELPILPDCRVNLNMVFGAPTPYFLPGQARYHEGNKIPAYRRLDAGFNYVFLKEGDKTKKLSKTFNSLWVGLEVFNMLGINNVISYLWVKDINNNVFGVPEFLTSRRVSLRIVASL
ncbi:MAG: TonB-dependent receptor [Bacteroidetes bacterium]|nr:TonB-dependent receptor [Bacteroidota bacterium]